MLRSHGLFRCFASTAIENNLKNKLKKKNQAVKTIFPVNVISFLKTH